MNKTEKKQKIVGAYSLGNKSRPQQAELGFFTTIVAHSSIRVDNVEIFLY